MESPLHEAAGGFAQHDIQANGQHWWALLNGIERGLCIFEMLYDEIGRAIDYRFLEVNATFERHTGLTDAVGKTARELVPNLEPHWVETYARVAATGEPLRFEQGSAAMGRWFEVDAVRVGGPDSHKVALLFSNISARRQAELDARFVSEVSERVRVSADADALLWEVTQALGEYLRAARCCFIAVDEPGDCCVVHPDYRAEPARPSIAGSYVLSAYPSALIAELRGGRVVTIPDTAHDPLTASAHETGFLPLDIHALVGIPLLREGRWAAALVVADVAAREWAAREVALLETLAERMWHAAEQLRAAEVLRASQERLALALQATESALVRAEAATRERDLLISIASHDLRTPLTVILGQAQLLLRRAERAGFDERNLRTIATIAGQADRLNQMIAALLDLSRIQEGQLAVRRAPHDLGALLCRVVDEIRSTLTEHELVLRLPPAPLMVSADPLRIEQVFHNLLGNAVKYSPDGGTIEVWAEADAAVVRVYVRDQGIGIPAEALPHLFERFYRAPNAAAQASSSMGVGLFVVRELVLAHGGAVTVESAEGQGSTFRVQLPLLGA